jgi:hypothetical protein
LSSRNITCCAQHYLLRQVGCNGVRCEDVDWNTLSAAGCWTLAHIAVPVSEGFTRREVATRINRTESFVKTALAELRAEITANAAAPAPDARTQEAA